MPEQAAAKPSAAPAARQRQGTAARPQPRGAGAPQAAAGAAQGQQPPLTEAQKRQALQAPCACGSGLKTLYCCGNPKLERVPPETVERLEPLMRQARAAAQRGRIEAALSCCVQILEHAPGHLEALTLLHNIRKAQGAAKAVEALLRRIVKLDPNRAWAAEELAALLIQKGNRVEAETLARNAIRLRPRSAQAHNLLGMLLTDANRLVAGEHHYRMALKYHEPTGRLYANLAYNLKQQGRLEESEEFYRQAAQLDPRNQQTLLGWVRLEETRRNFDHAQELLAKVKEEGAIAPAVRLTRAILYGRTKDYEKALQELDAAKDDGGQLSPTHLLEKGRLLDKLERFDEAWAAFDEAKRRIRAAGRNSYQDKRAALLARELKAFFTRQRLSLLPRAALREDMPQPVFIVGFPRSGTTMVEQTLTGHPAIAAGDELPFINDLARFLPRMLNSPLPYPRALADLWMGDNLEALDNARDFYLKRTQQLGILREGKRWFTDKMPLNETHLGLVTLVFPQSPVIHLHRHPLDVVVSVFSNYLTHGFNCAFDLKTIAAHYALIADLVEHYVQHLEMKYLPVRYEDVVTDQEPQVRRMLEFIGEPWHDGLLEFHENARYARTASYAQVTEKLYTSSLYRYRHYRKQLEPVLPILEPVIRRLGYGLD